MTENREDAYDKSPPRLRAPLPPPTPFHDDGKIVPALIDPLTIILRRSRLDGVAVLGFLGEAPKLDAAEARQVAVRLSNAPHMRSSSASPRRALPHARAGQGVDGRGAAGVMIAPPPYLRTDDQITGYFKQAQEAIGDAFPGCCRIIR